MSYDHHEKAGNEGDVVKHIALLAMLDTILPNHGDAEFRYADTFAGYAYSPLIRANEWEQGIGPLANRVDGLLANRHTNLWYEWYLRGRPQLLGGIYPGSSLIAADICRFHAKTPRLFLWDISPSVIANLIEVFQGQGHHIYTRPATWQPIVENADFLLIDPPGASMEGRRNYPHWPTLTNFFQNEDQHLLVWLPVIFNRRRRQTIEDTAPQREGALELGLAATVVRWRNGVRKAVGCQLFYRNQPAETHFAALRQAVDHVVRIAGWAVTHFP